MASTEQTALIRPVRDSDAAAIAAVFAHYVTDTVITFDMVAPTPDQWREKIRVLVAAGMPFVVLERDDVLVGYAYASAFRSQAAYRYTVENSIYLAPGATGRGYGRRLLDALLTGCAEAGVRQVVAVIADIGNDASIGLHRSAGFEVVGRLPSVGHKHGRWLDIVLMQRELVAAGD